MQINKDVLAHGLLVIIVMTVVTLGIFPKLTNKMEQIEKYKNTLGQLRTVMRFATRRENPIYRQEMQNLPNAETAGEEEKMMTILQVLREWRLWKQTWKPQICETECYDMMVLMKQQMLENQIDLNEMMVETQQRRMAKNALSWRKHLYRDTNDIFKVEWKK